MKDSQLEIYETLAKKYNLSLDHTQIICTSVFRFISRSMRDKELKSFNLPGLGKICIHESIKPYIQIRIQEKTKLKELELKENELTKEHSTGIH